jgi:DNA-directed RNA polymerase specialized sigma24 family protein
MNNPPTSADLDKLIELTKLATESLERLQEAVRRMSDARAHLIQQLHQHGLNPTDIGRAIGLSRARVHQIIYPNGKGHR